MKMNPLDAEPPAARCAAPSDMEAFASAFGGKAGDAMVRDGEKRIVIW